MFFRKKFHYASPSSEYLKVPAAEYVNDLGIEGRVLTVHRGKGIVLAIVNTAEERTLTVLREDRSRAFPIPAEFSDGPEGSERLISIQAVFIWSALWSQSHGPVYRLEPVETLTALDNWRQEMIKTKDMTSIFVKMKSRQDVFNGSGAQEATDQLVRALISPLMPTFYVCDSTAVWARFSREFVEYKSTRSYLTTKDARMRYVSSAPGVDGTFIYKKLLVEKRHSLKLLPPCTQHQSQQVFFLLVPGDIDAFFELPRLSPAVYPLLPSPQLPSITRHSSFTTSSPAYSPSSFDPDDIPATNQTPRTSACGLPLPLPADFDFRSYRKTPTELVAPDDMSLREKNADNCLVERANDASLRLTRAYAAAGSPAGVGDLDVGARLQPFFSYSEQEKALLVASKDVVDASGPLPALHDDADSRPARPGGEG
ncbi:hypothetical protein B0H14DRAFT_3562596 [Mycena olivaceomarginata]|nr:hypothetical protein B0H14DRAFT_3562596 [Mycena olivaceomarginata]